MSSPFPLVRAATDEEALSDALEYRRRRKGPLEFLGFLLSFLAQLFGVKVLLLTAAVTLAVRSGRISLLGVLGVLFLGVLLLLLQFFLRARRFIGDSLAPRQSVKKLPSYKDAALLAKASSMPVARLYEPLLSQPQEGYCGQATLLNMVRSVPSRTGLFKLPGRPAPMEAAQVRDAVLALKAFDRALRIKSVTLLGPLSLAEFEEQVRDLNRPSVRILANFLRAPLFFNDPDDQQRPNVLMRVFGGHWSPLGAYLPEEDLVLLLDLNAQYGKMLIPTRRLHEAVTTRQVYDGRWRGLVRVDLDL